jgi:hypothetical protein
MTGTFVPLPLLPLPPTSGEVLILFYFSLFCAVPAVMWKFRNHKVLLVGPIWRMIARETKRDRVEETVTEQLFDLLLKSLGNALLYIPLPVSILIRSSPETTNRDPPKTTNRDQLAYLTEISPLETSLDLSQSAPLLRLCYLQISTPEFVLPSALRVIRPICGSSGRQHVRSVDNELIFWALEEINWGYD